MVRKTLKPSQKVTVLYQNWPFDQVFNSGILVHQALLSTNGEAVISLVAWVCNAAVQYVHCQFGGATGVGTAKGFKDVLYKIIISTWKSNALGFQAMCWLLTQLCQHTRKDYVIGNLLIIPG